MPVITNKQNGDLYLRSMGWDDKVCRCGRQNRLFHCIRCGSSNSQATAKRSVFVIDGQEFEFRTVKCRKCGESYTGWHMSNWCEAPRLFEQKVKEATQALNEVVGVKTNVAEKGRDYMLAKTPEEKRKAMLALLHESEHTKALVKDDIKYPKPVATKPIVAGDIEYIPPSVDILDTMSDYESAMMKAKESSNGDDGTK
jgi:predicted nucleic-acid-binding Zn-ribbon protein